MNDGVENYLSALPEGRRQLLGSILELALTRYPKATLSMRYKMPTVDCGAGWVAVASQKHYVSLYTCGAAHLEGFKAKHPNIKTGKGCINLKPDAPAPLDDLLQVIEHAIEHPKS
jgi:uncharacterized protein YdhG (YjbR/CyaY superfamily)